MLSRQRHSFPTHPRLQLRTARNYHDRHYISKLLDSSFLKLENLHVSVKLPLGSPARVYNARLSACITRPGQDCPNPHSRRNAHYATGKAPPRIDSRELANQHTRAGGAEQLVPPLFGTFRRVYIAHNIAGASSSASTRQSANNRCPRPLGYVYGETHGGMRSMNQPIDIHTYCRIYLPNDARAPK